MKKSKRVLALLGAILLVLLYVGTLVFALIDHPLASGLFKAAVAATILVPVILYGFLMFRTLVRHEDGDDEA